MRSILRLFLHSHASALGRAKDLAQVRLTSVGERPKAGGRDLSAAVPAAATVVNVQAVVAQITALRHRCSFRRSYTLPRHPVEHEIIWGNQSLKELQRKTVSASLSYRGHPRAGKATLSRAAVDS